MANVPISSLPSASSVSSTDLVPLVHNNTTVGATVQQMVNAAIATAMATIEREDKVLNVLCDGTDQPISFTSAFPVGSTVGTITFGVSDYDGTDNPALSVPRIVGTPTISGFTINIGGGQSGQTISLHYRARLA